MSCFCECHSEGCEIVKELMVLLDQAETQIETQDDFVEKAKKNFIEGDIYDFTSTELIEGEIYDFPSTEFIEGEIFDFSSTELIEGEIVEFDNKKIIELIGMGKEPTLEAGADDWSHPINSEKSARIEMENDEKRSWEFLQSRRHYRPPPRGYYLIN
jgi:hypothetical protein